MDNIRTPVKLKNYDCDRLLEVFVVRVCFKTDFAPRIPEGRNVRRTNAEWGHNGYL